MDNDDRCREMVNSRLEDLPRMDDARIECADGEFHLGNDAVGGVEGDDDKNFVCQIPETRNHDCRDIIRRPYDRMLPAGLRLKTPANLKRGSQFHCFCRANTPQSHELARVSPRDGQQISISLQEAA
jgi:hypothetical protein